MKRTISLIITLFALSISAQQNLYIGSYYVTTTEEEKLYGDGGDKWTNRLPVICDMFNFEQPDVLGLQSLTEAQLSKIKLRLTAHNAATDILYNKNTIQLDTCGTLEGLPEGSTCSWAKFTKGEKDFYVFNVCFQTDLTNATTAATAVRTAIAEMNPGNLPTFVLGYLGVSDGKTPYSRIIAKYNDCYTKAPVVSAEYGTVNNFDLAANHSSDRYDFVFASRNITVLAYGQLQYSYFTQESDGTNKRRLPSTHFPVMAKVKLP